jgi:Ni2+-binding GTPase involved in maturation of urease and hydrogenase
MSEVKAPRGMGLKQLLAMKFDYLEPLPERMRSSFGRFTRSILMIVYGESGSGKSTLLMELINFLLDHGKVDYVALEEGYRSSTQRKVMEALNEEKHTGRIKFYDHRMSYDHLVRHLAKKKSADFVVIDSIQYWRITYQQYQALKERFPKKGFIFISHAKGKKPSGKLAIDIEYDVDYKVRVEGGIAFVKSREGGNKPYVIWEEGAKRYWKRRYKALMQ